KSSSQPKREHIKKDKGKKAMSSEDAKKQSTNSDSNDDETHMTSSMVESSRINKVKKFDFATEGVNKYYNYKLQYDRYCNKMLNKRSESRITNCDVLTKKGPITLRVYREDGISEVIPKFKASDLHLGEWREVMNASVLGMILFNSYHRQDFVTIKYLKDFSNTMYYIVQEIFFRRHQGPGLDDIAWTFSSLLLAEIDKRNLNPLKQIMIIEQLRQ
ncbi:hypothetical protein Tco_1083950, partial [Tanacetum coccineum]